MQAEKFRVKKTMIAIAFQIKDAMFICTLGFTWKEESPTAPSGVLDPGGVAEEVTSGKSTN